MYLGGDRIPPGRSRLRSLPWEMWTLKDENLKFRSNVVSIHFISMPHYFNDVYFQAHIFFMCIGANPLPLRPNQGPRISLRNVVANQIDLFPIFLCLPEDLYLARPALL